MHSSFQIILTTTKGKVMVARRTLLAGFLLLREEPIAVFSKPSPDSSPLEDYTSAFHQFRKFPPSKQKKYFELFGPTVGMKADAARSVSREIGVIDDSSGASRLLSPEEVENFVKCTQIYRLNTFREGDSAVVMNDITRMSHSCSPNCIYENRSIRVIQTVHENEELTISYNEVLMGAQSTPSRRDNYFRFKDFTCHCARCTSPADDTRQFRCIDPACTGQHYACQPLSSEPVRPTFLEEPLDCAFMPPHLLPCSACGLEATKTYESEVFALEAKLPEVLNYNKNMLSSAAGVNGWLGVKHRMNDVLTRHLARADMCEMDLALLVGEVVQTRARGKEIDETAAMAAVMRYADIFDHSMMYPNEKSMVAYELVSDSLVELSSEVQVLVRAKEFIQKALRMSLVMHGGDCTLRGHLDVKLRAINTKLAARGTGNCSISSRCLFCDVRLDGVNLKQAEVAQQMCGVGTPRDGVVEDVRPGVTIEDRELDKYCSLGCMHAGLLV